MRPNPDSEPTAAELLAELTWEDVLADGFLTTEEVDESLRQRGADPADLLYLYD